MTDTPIAKTSFYRADIDGLRMLAVVPVVFNHAGLPGFSGGFIGVDIFFVISGYLITHILITEIEEKRFSVLRFYERRARRILPALFVVIAACLVAGWFIFSPHRFDNLGKSVIATLAFVSNVWFWLEAGDYFSPAVELELLLHTWSLAVEEQFYVFFPLLLWAMVSLGRAFRIRIVWVIVILSFCLSVWLTQAAPIANFYLVPTRAWELGAGCLIALGAFPMTKNQAIREAAGWIGLALIVISIVTITGDTPFPGLAALPAVVGTTLFIYAGTEQKTSAGLLMSFRPFVWVGLISYSLYLWHWPILVIARDITASVSLTIPVAFLCILLSVCMAWLSWYFVEKPFRRTSGKRTFSGRQIFILSASGAAALGICGATIAVRDGWVGQFSDTQMAIYQSAVERDPLELRCAKRALEDTCQIGRQDIEPSVAIWGDSHAGALLPAFDEWLHSQQKSGLGFTKGACPALLGAVRTDQPPGHNCDLRNASVLKRVISTTSLDTVILFSRWALAAEGTRAENEYGALALLAERNDTSAPDISKNAQLVETGLEHLISHLRKKQLNVIIILGTPEIGYHVPDVVLSRSEQNTHDIFRPQLEDVEERQARADGIIREVAKRHGAHVLSPRAVMCAERCSIEVGGYPLYRDNNHLSAFGSRWLVSQLMAGVD